MKNIKAYAVGAVFAALASVSTAASAEVITFDDLWQTASVWRVDNGYHGMNWDNMYYVRQGYYPDSGYDHGIVSGLYTGFNGSGNPASFSSDNAFTLNSIYVTKAWRNGVTRFDGYVGNTLTYTKDVTSNTVAPDLVAFNWTGVNRVTMTSLNYSWQTAIDNVNVTQVPEPESYALMLAGLAMVGLLRKRRKSA